MSYIHVNFLTMLTPKETYLEATEHHENGKFHGSQEPHFATKICVQKKKVAIPFVEMNFLKFQA